MNLRDRHRFVILTEGNTHPIPAKTAMGIIRYRRDEVVALLDSTQAGKDAFELLGAGDGIPIYSTLEESLGLLPTALVIGIAPAGGTLPPQWRAVILRAIQNGLDVISGLHTFLSDDVEISAAAKKAHSRLIDLRRPPEDLSVNKCLAKEQSGFRVHTVGTDCNCGKKLAAIEIDRALKNLGKNSEFIATGQTGMLISGKGIALDRVISDFVAGAAERLVVENSDHDYLLIEGQGAITHPLYSGVTLSMLHGFMPHALVLCHMPGRDIMRGSKDTPILPIEEIISIYETVARPVFPAKVVGVALNLMSLSMRKAKRIVDETADHIGLPTTDLIKFGAEPLVKAILEYENEWHTSLE